MTGSLESLDLILSVIIDDEPPCESPHQHTECSGDVTHLMRDCRRRLPVCDNAAVYIRDHMQGCFSRGSRCAHCTRPAETCWRLVPV